MKTKGKAWQLVVTALLIVVFVYTAFFGVAAKYGDVTTTYIKGAKDIRFGVDIKGGVNVTFVPSDGYDATDEQLDAARLVIENRLVALNVTDYELYVDNNSDSLILEFPWQSGETDFDPESAIQEIGTTAYLTFREGASKDGELILDGSMVESASAQYGAVSNGGSSEYYVALKFTTEGAKAFGDATTKLAADKGSISIWLDDENVSTASVNAAITDGSAIITGVLLAFNLPSNLPIWIIILGALFAIGVGKMSFGGLGCNPFNPALAGRVFLLLSFPVQMTSWPVVGQLTAYTDATTGATPLALMKQAIYGDTAALSQIPDALTLLIGQNGGCLGEVSALALLIGLVYMLWKKIITWHIPVSILATVFVFAGIMHLADPEKYVSPVLQLLSGGLMLGAVFMATDYVTSPMSKKGMLIYGVCIGLLTVVIRLFGAYPEGMSFAILIMNAFTPLINTYCKPKRFGEVAKKK